MQLLTTAMIKKLKKQQEEATDEINNSLHFAQLIMPVVLNIKAKYLLNFDIFFILGHLCLS